MDLVPVLLYIVSMCLFFILSYIKIVFQLYSLLPPTLAKMNYPASGNPSVENLNDMAEKGRPPYLSSINMNSSSTNLFKLQGSKQSKDLHQPVPKQRINLANYLHFSSYLLPPTPPISAASTPIKHRFESESESVAVASSWLPPVDLKICGLCTLWYWLSIVSSNSTKMILSQYKYPITLTQCQFLINSVLCVALLAAVRSSQKWYGYFPKGVIPACPQKTASALSVKQFLSPTAFIISTTFPMGCFQFAGHLSSHKATSLIPVSLVHAIKALSPLITVLIYRTVYHIKYKPITYLTLIPLVLGVMLTCYKKKNARTTTSSSYYLVGLGYAFISMLIFVSQNIFAKKRLTIEKHDVLPTSKDSAPSANKKLDKLTILFYCSMIGFIFTLPVYLVSEFTNPHISIFELSVLTSTLIALNGFSHFLQSLLAFQILGLMSPITYSIANILKRIIIIIIAFLWESKTFTGLQAAGLILTIFGLYCYDRWGSVHIQPKEGKL